jgi:hypothetical protein
MAAVRSFTLSQPYVETGCGPNCRRSSIGLRWTRTPSSSSGMTAWFNPARIRCPRNRPPDRETAPELYEIAAAMLLVLRAFRADR